MKYRSAVIVGVLIALLAVVGLLVALRPETYVFEVRYEEPGGELLLTPAGDEVPFGPIQRYRCSIHWCTNRWGHPAVGVTLIGADAVAFTQATGERVDHQMAVILDDRVAYAVLIEDTLPGSTLFDIPEGWTFEDVEDAMLSR